MKLLYITNIPAPYRQKRFNTMAEIFPKYGIDFEVLYMAKIEPNRKWIISCDSYRYNYKIFKGIHPRIGRFFAHFNPGLLLRLLRDDYDVAIVGGMASPTHWLTPFFINGSKKQVMSIESNLLSVQRISGIGAKIKSHLLKKADAYQVTGQPQIEYVRYFNPGQRNKKFIKLPNLIDETVYRDKVAHLRSKRHLLRETFGVTNDIQMWVLPARWIPVKGIIPFLDLLEGIRNIKIFLLGDGALSNSIDQLITNKKLPVVKVGFVQQNEMVNYYAAADLFVLPSIKDPSPLTPIEAIASSLPILVSSRIGNLDEVLNDGNNGWSYDPVTETEKGRKIIDFISSLTNEHLKKMGMKSSVIYNKEFSSKICIERYAKELIEFYNDK